MKKEGYFQGSKEPKPGKKQYKSEPKVLDIPRFKTPFFRNIDYIDSESGPGESPYRNMKDYKSIADFLERKSRKRNKDKYKGDTFEQENDGSINKVKSAQRLKILNKIVKNAIDFAMDSINDPILTPDNGIPSISFMGENFLQPNDLEGRSPEQIDYATYDYFDNKDCKFNMDEIINNFLNPAEGPPFGIPNITDPISDLDADQTISKINNEYGTLDTGSEIYKDVEY